ncbi:MAG: SUMF1/EgtB/PvdO family nonheme iron enzyme [Chloroflexi bacterium]|nr:SUMF1/EgtB/PvdO family nonheme iron enzyme [Chloroflexota bacterium]
MTDPRAEIQKIKEDIRRLEELRQSGALPPDLADVSIAALKSKLPIYQAELQGAGAIAQGDGAKAVGKGGVLVGDHFQGNIYVGEQPENDEQALMIFRRMVMQTTSSMPLRGVDVGASDATQSKNTIGLANVYVDLDTTTRTLREKEELSHIQGKEENSLSYESVIRETKPISLLQAVSANRSSVILGDPGSGKSTFVNFLAYCLAAHTLEPTSGWLKHLQGWKEEDADLLPVVVILRDFARAYADALPQKVEVSHIWNFIEDRLKAQNLESAIKPLRAALEAGKAILLFDGLDEVPTEKQRIFVRDAVRVFIKRYDQCRYLVTCRVLSYQPPAHGKPDLRLDELSSFEIAEFDDEKISRFVEAWYSELARLGTVKTEDREALTAKLGEAVQRSDLRRLSSNPLLLTVMALVHTHKGRLPDARALLYEETIEILLWRWEQIKLGGQDDSPRLRQYLMEAGRTDLDLKRFLREIAYQAHSATKPDEKNEALADIDEHSLIKSLSALKRDDQNPDGDWNWARRIVDLMKLRAGLLLERQPGIFTFPHRTFQEYLAGAHLASQNNFARCAVELTPQKALWREVILYAVGKLVYVAEDLDKPLALVAELCPEKGIDTDLAWGQAWLAGDVLQEIGVNRVSDSAFGRDLLCRVQSRLTDLIKKGKLAPRERNHAGNTLSTLGDLRFNPDLWHLPADETLGFTLIPAGKFLMGNNDRDDEKPQHEVPLPDFWMARYPVTVAQFRAFTEATKYSFEYWKYNNTATHPVVAVTWYEALKYTQWLDKELRQHAERQIQSGVKNSLWQGLAEGKLRVSLPSEAEWEKSARGGSPLRSIPEGRLLGDGQGGEVYPWQGGFDPDKANTSETKIGDPSVVGCFPAGASPYGLLDMSGNVWEWTRSVYKKYPYQPGDGREEIQSKDARVLRGGSFFSEASIARCAFRRRGNPVGRLRSFGFRVVVVSPALPSRRL